MDNLASSVISLKIQGWELGSWCNFQLWFSASLNSLSLVISYPWGGLALFCTTYPILDILPFHLFPEEQTVTEGLGLWGQMMSNCNKKYCIENNLKLDIWNQDVSNCKAGRGLKDYLVQWSHSTLNRRVELWLTNKCFLTSHLISKINSIDIIYLHIILK